MTAEGNLYNPTLLVGRSDVEGLKPGTSPSTLPAATCIRKSSDFFTLPGDSGAYLPATVIAREYLDIVRALRTSVHSSAIKGHLFKLLRPSLGFFTDLRASLGRIGGKKTKEELLDEYIAIVEKVEERLHEEIADVKTGKVLLDSLIQKDERTGLPLLPRWLAQPYFRPPQQKLSAPAQVNGVKERISLQQKHRHRPSVKSR